MGLIKNWGDERPFSLGGANRSGDEIALMFASEIRTRRRRQNSGKKKKKDEKAAARRVPGQSEAAVRPSAPWARWIITEGCIFNLMSTR